MNIKPGRERVEREEAWQENEGQLKKSREEEESCNYDYEQRLFLCLSSTFYVNATELRA